MSFNLVRNSRLFFTTNVNASTGVIERSGATVTSANTTEIQVLDGFSFTQSTQQTTIQIAEAGSAPVRGQRAFNVTLDPVDITFSTYIRPHKPSTSVNAEESVLWNAIFSDVAMGTSVALGGTVTLATTYSAGTGELTIAGTAMTFAGVVVGEVYNMSGFTGASGPDYNAPARVKTLTATSIVLTYLDAPTSVAPSATTAVKFNTSAWTDNIAQAGNAAFGQVTSALSNKNQLQKFGMIFLVDNAVYAIDNCVVDQASIDFSLDGIATIAWTIKGTKLNYIDTATISTANPAVFGGTGLATGTAKAKETTANYITNKLSTMQLKGNIGGSGGTTYTVALTGGNITIANNVNYITPSNLGVVNEPIGYFTGSRSISGNVTAYLRVGTNLSAQLLKDILTLNASETKFYTQIEIGGLANLTKVEVLMPGCLLQVPTVETADVISTTINFTAQGHSNIAGATAIYDIAAANDLRIRYFSA
jgi:hypothetical protein